MLQKPMSAPSEATHTQACLSGKEGDYQVKLAKVSGSERSSPLKKQLGEDGAL